MSKASIKTKIAALRAKTLANGRTEAEALAAASARSLRRAKRPYIRDSLYSTAADAGWAAGASVALNHGVAGQGTDGPPLRIGR